MYITWRRFHNKDFCPSNCKVITTKGTKDAMTAFIERENGKVTESKHFRLLRAALEGKKLLNLQIKQWAAGYIECGGKRFVEELRQDYPWFREWIFQAVINQGGKIYFEHK